MERTGTVQIEEKIWGKLVSKSKSINDYQLKAQRVTIGRKANNTLVINQQRLSGQHCIITKCQGKVFIEDKSSNGTFVNNTKMSKGAKLQLQDGNQIWLLHPSKVGAETALGYIFILSEKKNQPQAQQTQKEEDQTLKRKQQMQELQKQIKKKTTEQFKKIMEQQQKSMLEQKKKMESQMNTIKQQITCCICLQIMFLPVTVHPCNHRFCGSCLTGLIKSKQQNCAQCRKQITTAQRDSSFNSLIQDYLKNHPDEIKSKQQQQQMIKTNMFNHDPIDVHEVIHGKKRKKQTVIPAIQAPSVPLRSGRAPRRQVRRTGSDLSAGQSDDQPVTRCRQCNISRNGFQCSPTQVHVSCITCSKLIARRDDPALNQRCILCDQYFCNLYYPPCSTTGIKLQQVRNRQSQVKLDQQTFRGNSFELTTLKNYLQQKKLNSKQLFRRILTNFLDKNTYRYLVDRKVMKVAPIGARQIPVTRQSPVCDGCWKDLWFQMVLTFRIQINNELPPAIMGRPQCYYGVNCKTMGHNSDHAKKLNHCCFQTKF